MLSDISPLNYNNIHILPVQTIDIFFMQNTIASFYSHFEATHELDMFLAAHVRFTFLVYFSVYDSHTAYECLLKYLKSISPKKSNIRCPRDQNAVFSIRSTCL